MRGLNLDQLRTFAAVVDQKSFSGAAALLGITQPAVSLQVRQLEKRFGVKLIERVGRRAAPTAAGAELLTHARDVEAALAAAADAMAPHAQGAAGRVRLGTGATACIYLLPKVLRDLRQRFPALEIVVSTGNTPDMLRAIEENRIDVGAGHAAGGRPHARRTAGAGRRVRARGAARHASLPRDITAAELAKLPLVQYEPGANTRRVVDDWALRAGLSLKAVMELGSVEAMKELVGAGLGCSVLPRMALRGKQEPFVVRPLKPRLYRKLALVLRRDKPLTKGLRELMRAIAALK